MSDKKETEPSYVSSRTLTTSELEELIYSGQSFPRDKRFLSTEKGGVFKYFDLDDITQIQRTERFFPVIEVDSKIVGLAELENKPNTELIYWLKFLSIDTNSQGKGYASRLAEEIFQFAYKKGFSIETSSYSQEGFQKLKPLLQRFSNKYNVNFIDKEETV